MKKVSFKVAKAIKEAGYPQNTDYLYDNDGTFASKFDYESWGISTWNKIAMPTYIEVWFWLWREKKIAIGCPYENTYNYWFTNIDAENDKSLILWKYSSRESKDPEEAIIAAIEYLVDNNLIK